MKIKVTNNYIDKDTKEPKSVGDVVEYAEERAKSLISRGFAEEVTDIEEDENHAEIEEKTPKKSNKKA